MGIRLVNRKLQSLGAGLPQSPLRCCVPTDIGGPRRPCTRLRVAWEAEFVFVSLRNGLGHAPDEQPDPSGRFSGENLRLENAQGQGGGERKGFVQYPEKFGLKKINMATYKIIPFYSLTCISTSNPKFSTTPMFVIFFFFPPKNIKLNNRALLQTALQQALLGGALRSQESVAQDKYPAPNFIIRGAVTSLRSQVNDGDRIRLVPNHINSCWKQAGP